MEPPSCTDGVSARRSQVLIGGAGQADQASIEETRQQMIDTEPPAADLAE